MTRRVLAILLITVAAAIIAAQQWEIRVLQDEAMEWQRRQWKEIQDRWDWRFGKGEE